MRAERRRRVRQHARRDANHDELVGLFVALGCSVLDVSQVAGALDLVIGVAGVDQRVEIKDGAKEPSRRRLTEAERDEIDAWRGREPVIVETTRHVITLVADLREHGWSRPVVRDT